VVLKLFEHLENKKPLMIIFEIESKLNKKIRLTEKLFNEIKQKHPEVISQENKIKETLINPNVIRKSQYENNAWLFYKFFKTTPVTQKHLMAAIKLLNDDGFVITVYFTDRIKIGEEIWKEK
jgi:hypothetical protein